MEGAVPGLRERKRLATERALQIALLRRALEAGSDAATVEDACQEAGVSSRTFFNYFASKEDALVGRIARLEPDALQAAAFEAGGGDVLDDLVHLIASVFDDADEDRTVHRMRRSLLQREPRLVAVRIASAHQAQQQAVALVARRLEASGQDPARADVVVLVALAAVRAGWTRWLTGADRPLAAAIVEALGDVRAVAAGQPALA